MTLIDEQSHRRRHGRHFLIPAGALIGLGAGMIAGYPLSGVLIGLGLGFIGSGFVKPAESPVPDTGVHRSSLNRRWMSMVIGLFMIIIGVGIIWAPVNFWTYGVGIILIGLGVLFAVKSMEKSG